MRSRARATSLLLIASSMFVGCSGDSEESASLQVAIRYEEGWSNLQVSLNRGLASEETLHARVRQGEFGELRCGADSAAVPRIDESPAAATEFGPAFEGPVVDGAMFESPFNDPAWLQEEPTPEMLEAIAAGQWIVDVCLMNGASVVLQEEMSIREALDRAGENGKFDGGEEERIRSTSAYAEACVAELGEIPFFEPLGEGDYGTYNCLDSTPIPMTVTDAEGNVEYPETEVSQCDNPQYIYSSCEPNAVAGRTNGPRVASRRNGQGTHWVLLCRKAKADEGEYNDIAMIGHNPYTGRTCFFQNALYQRTDGLHVPHPGDVVDSEASPEESATLWEGIHGGLGSGIQCAGCHDADPFIHTPWIDGALDENGDPVIPKMGIDDDFASGFNEAPYSLVNAAGQGWDMPRMLVSDEVAACTRCHRMGAEGAWGGWQNYDWIDRLVGESSRWNDITTEAYRTFEHQFWMPPEIEGGVTEEDFWESDYGIAVRTIQACSDDPDAEGCEWAELPTEQLVDPGEPPPIELTGLELAREAAKILGARLSDPDDERCTGEGGACQTRRCSECHSVSRNGLRHWEELTQEAWGTCGLNQNPEEMSQDQAMASVNCMRADPEDPESVFAAERLGILTAGVQYGYFRKLFRAAYGEETWLPEYLRFRARVSMPKGNHPSFSQREFATVLKWYQAGLGNLRDAIEDPPAPDTCTDLITPALVDHVDAMRFEGWQAENEEAGLRMFGCRSDNPLECMADELDLSETWGHESSPGVLKQMTVFGFRTSFWTRASADGRFVGNGGSSGSGGGATITDLLRGIDIGVKASYDPGFFPDNSGFIFQGGAGMCPQSVLETEDHIDFTEEGCNHARGINLYQHVARGLNGGDYFIINSQFTSDGGGGGNNPRANFSADATMKFTPMFFNGTSYDQLEQVIVDSPFEGDSVLSPSGEVVISRLAGPESRSLGYVLRRVNAQRQGDNYRIDIREELGRVCFEGAKPNISYDERFIVTHVYEDDTANIYLVDMVDGTRYQITNMPAGSAALFPHFRSDGWFYFLVRIGTRRVLVASDAAVRLVQQSQ